MTGKIEALMAPRNVVLVGASDRNWSRRIWINLQRFSFEGEVFPVNPGRAEIWGQRCYPDLDALPAAPDHLVLLVPNEQTLDILDRGAELGARSASIFAAGFGEGGDAAGRARAARLRDILQRRDIAAVGPNCMGLAVGRSRFCTFPDEQIEPLGVGPIAAITQSGTLAQTLCRGLAGAGLDLGYLVSCGNQTGLTFADYIDHLAGDPHLKVIACYIESVVDGPRFLAAADKARRSGKALIVVKAGVSRKARDAALAHTGSLAGSALVFDAFAREVGILRFDTLEDMVEAAAYFARAKRPSGPGLALMTNSGALKTLAVDAAESCGNAFAALAPETCAKLRRCAPNADDSNPFDTKNTLPTEAYLRCVEALHDDPNVGLLLIAEDMPREPGVARKEHNLKALDEWVASRASKPVAVFSPVVLRETPHMADLRAQLAHLPFLRDLGKTLRIAAKIATPPLSIRTDSGVPAERASLVAHWRARAASLASPTALNELESKGLLAAYGVMAPDEALAASGEEALAAAQRIGFPIILKAVSAAVTHKTDSGLVCGPLSDEAGLTEAANALLARCAALGLRADGLLVAKCMTDGVEFVVGAHRDPEMGHAVMVGLGGIWLDLFKDVAFAPPWLDEDAARRAIGSTRAAALLAGYRGAPVRDADALARAMVAIGRLTLELGDVVESVDVNPLLVRARGDGALALDGLVVLRPPQPPRGDGCA